jgi:hypothetical protein
MDEPLWSVGRISSKGGHCFPLNPACSRCMFCGVCAKEFRDIVPDKIGMKTYSYSERKQKKSAVTEYQTEFANFIAKLHRKGITGGEQFRELRDQWQREHKNSTSEET